MQTTPKSLRLQIGLVGRTNVGKSSFLNYIAGQDVAVTSPVPGTTTDVVEKAMELLPIGPVMFLDTAGLDDRSELGERRLQKTAAALERADIVVLLTEPNQWGEFEERVVAEAAPRKQPVIVVVNKTDLLPGGTGFQPVSHGQDARATSAFPSIGKGNHGFFQALETRSAAVVAADAVSTGGTPVPQASGTGLRPVISGWLECSCLDAARRERVVCHFKELLLKACPDDYVNPSALVADLLPPGGLMVMVVPIDLQAPKGRLILPQVQAIRDALDGDAAALVVKEREYAALLGRLNRPPDLVVCDSQVVLKMVADTPREVKCTTFSILFARYKGDLQALARGAAMIDRLRAGDRVLVAESCSHHALEDDIGRVKIPRWLRQYTGLDVQIDVSAGRDFPQDLSGYKLVVHCGSCMLTRREMLAHIQRAQAQGVAITNYGLAISVTQGVLKRALSPFPAALDAYEREMADG